MDKNIRIGQLHEKLTALANKRNLAADPLWRQANDELRADIIARLEATAHGEDEDRRRQHLTIALRLQARLRTIMEGGGESAKTLEDELDRLEGRRLAPIA